MPTILYRTKAPSSFVALSNIESFVAAAKAFGVPETSLFQPSDLVDGRKGPLLYVLNCLNQLGLIVRVLYSAAYTCIKSCNTMHCIWQSLSAASRAADYALGIAIDFRKKDISKTN